MGVAAEKGGQNGSTATSITNGQRNAEVVQKKTGTKRKRNHPTTREKRTAEVIAQDVESTPTPRRSKRVRIDKERDTPETVPISKEVVAATKKPRRKMDPT